MFRNSRATVAVVAMMLSLLALAGVASAGLTRSPATVSGSERMASSAEVAQLRRAVIGPAFVVPGRVYSLRVAGFAPGEKVYSTVQPAACARASERCEQDPCPSCRAITISPLGRATIRFRWPRESIYAAANMETKQLPWKVGSPALIRIDLASRSVPKGCERMSSLTANPQAGSIVCATTLTTIR